MEEKVQILKDIVSFKTVNDNEILVAQYLSDLFERYDIPSKIIEVSPRRVNLIAEIGSGSPVIALSGHMDVVSEGDLALWDSNPFELTEKNGKLYGRGSADMKSGLAALVISMIEIKMNNLLKRGTIRLMATTGEEVGEAGSKRYFEDGYCDDIDALIIGEPSQDDILYAHKGSMDLKITSTGKAAHSSIPELGYNAIDQLMSYLMKANHIFRDDERETPSLGKLVMNTTIFNGGNQVNSIPEQAVAELNVRTIPEFDNDEVEDIFRKLADDFNQERHQIDVAVAMSLNSVFTKPDSVLTSLAQKIGQKYFGQLPDVISSPAVTDAANLLKNKDDSFNFIFYGPGLTKMAHQVNEFVEKDDYLKFIDLYQELILSFIDEF